MAAYGFDSAAVSGSEHKKKLRVAIALKYGEIPWHPQQREGEQYMMHCPHCHGKGCYDCDDDGTYELPCDPVDYAVEVWPIIRVADVWRKGTPPEAGGLMDQPAALTDCVRFVWADEDHIKSEKMGNMALLL